MKTKKLQERRKKQLLAAKAAKPRKSTVAKKATQIKTEKDAAEKAAAPKQVKK